MAGKTWSDLRAAIEDWHASRRAAAAVQLKQDAERLRSDIVQEIISTSEGKTPNTSELEARTTMDSTAKQELLSPKSKLDADKPSPLGSLDLYTNSIIIDDESSGTNVIQVVKLDNMRKKDGTTGMSLAKIAKAVEFGTSRSAPRPAWRRSLKKLEQTGAYRKKQ